MNSNFFLPGELQDVPTSTDKGFEIFSVDIPGLPAFDKTIDDDTSSSEIDIIDLLENAKEVVQRDDELIPEPFLENAKEVVQRDNELIPEPTPIHARNIDIVDQVPVTELSWYNNESLSASIYSLLATEPQCFKKPTSFQASLSDVDDSFLFPNIRNSKNNDQSSSKNSTGIPNYDPTSLFSDSDDTNPAISRTNSMSSMSISQSSECKDQSLHSERWNERYQDLVEFHRIHKHCLVPSTYFCNRSLGHWVKRQRYQYNLKMNGSHSTLTKDREDALEKLGFIWDSHSALWEERWNDLRLYQERHGHCNVPKRYPENPKLANWIKCQRRQYKLFISGKLTNMNTERIMKLQYLGFVLNPLANERK